MSVLKGKDGFLWVFRDGGYVLLACSKTLSIEFDVEDIPIATQNSGTDRDYDPGFSDCTINFDSLGTLDETTKYQFEEFIENRRVKHQLKLVFTDSSSAILQYEFSAKVKRISVSADVKAFAPVSGTLRVCGPITKTRVYDPGSGGGSAPPVSTATAYADWWETTPGQYSISGPSAIHGYDLLGVSILMVWRSGMLYDFIGYSGVPSGRQCRYDNSLEQLFFDSSLPFETDETVTVLFQ